MTRDVFDVIRTGASLANPATGEWLTPQDIHAPVVVFIHGFTSHGRYMTQLANYARAHGFVAAIFNYDSYLGIERGATDLLNRLKVLATQLENFGYAFVAHSMGGFCGARLRERRLGLVKIRVERRCVAGRPE